MSDYHLSLSIGKSLWNDLVGNALPMQVSEGAFDLGRTVYQGVRQLQVRQKVSALLEDRAGTPTVKRAKDRLSEIWAKNEVAKFVRGAGPCVARLHNSDAGL